MSDTITKAVPPVVFQFGKLKVTLILGDCRILAPMIEGIDAVISDPPYGIDFSHGQGGDGIGGGKYVSKFNGQKIIGDEAPFDPSPWVASAPIVVLWGANHFANDLPRNSHWLVWDKRCGLTKNDFADCEIAWCNQGHVARVFRHYWNGMMRDSERKSPRVHPTQKPVVLMSWCMEEARVPPGATVLDPYMGSGTTGIACLRTGRNFVGIEQDPKHFETAVSRIRHEIAQGEPLC